MSCSDTEKRRHLILTLNVFFRLFGPVIFIVPDRPLLAESSLSFITSLIKLGR